MDESTHTIDTRTEAHGDVPPPPRKNRLRPRTALAGVWIFAIDIAATAYYLVFVAPYESTGDAFVDGYATLVSSRLPGPHKRLLVRDNVQVQRGQVLVELDLALQDTENALVAYSKERSRRQALVPTVRSSQAAFQLSSELYQSGLVDFLNVLVSERALYNAQDALVESTQTMSLDLVQLYKALGGGWQQGLPPESVN